MQRPALFYLPQISSCLSYFIGQAKEADGRNGREGSISSERLKLVLSQARRKKNKKQKLPPLLFGELSFDMRNARETSQTNERPRYRQCLYRRNAATGVISKPIFPKGRLIKLVK
jgi:hypothetical protein